MKPKETYRQKVEAQIKELTARLAVMEEQARRFSADAKKAAAADCSDADKRLAELRARLATLRDAGDGAWQEMKKGVEAAWSELGEAATRAKKHFGPPPAKARTR
jgi:septal ring factor EnvC (AmiA/AmiB activator)